MWHPVKEKFLREAGDQEASLSVFGLRDEEDNSNAWSLTVKGMVVKNGE